MYTKLSEHGAGQLFWRFMPNLVRLTIWRVNAKLNALENMWARNAEEKLCLFLKGFNFVNKCMTSQEGNASRLPSAASVQNSITAMLLLYKIKASCSSRPALASVLSWYRQQAQIGAVSADIWAHGSQGNSFKTITKALLAAFNSHKCSLCLLPSALVSCDCCYWYCSNLTPRFQNKSTNTTKQY